MPLVGFLPQANPRVRGTLRAIEHKLLADGELVLRYETDNPQTACRRTKTLFWHAASGS
jgi:GH15 family glucan-1,4-alpha-glucosidase